MTKKRNLTEREMLELTFNPPDIDLNEAFSPEAKKAAKSYQERRDKKLQKKK